MVYVPEAVADAILFAAAHPRRDMYIGTQSKLFTVLAGIAPRTMDKVMENVMYPTQLAPRPAKNAQTNALYKPGYGLQEHGSQEGWFRSRSLYVKAQKYPLLTYLAAAGLGLGAWALAGRRGKRLEG